MVLATQLAARAFGVLLMLTAGCSAGDSKPATHSKPSVRASEQAAAGSCDSTVTTNALPEWGRAGFRGSGEGIPHVFSEHGDLIAVLFNYPPVASTDPNVGNKILWISHLPQQPMHPLRIEAALDGTKTSVIREIAGGAGPSGVNLPMAGCWHLRLNWSGHTDKMTLKLG